MTATSSATLATAVIWHEAECGGYGADLPFWERLASEHAGSVLDLGAGSGRVALHLAARGHEVVAVDSEPALLAAMERRASGRGLAVGSVAADVRELDLGRRFGLVLAPMQLVHLLGGPAGRGRAWGAIARHLRPDGVLALTLLQEPLPPSGRPAPFPDVREVEGWIHSSLPVDVRVDDERVELDRLRQIVSPSGELTEELVTTSLDRIPPAVLERELASAGLTVIGAETIDETREHVGSLLVCARPTHV